MKINPEFRLREIAGETVIVHQGVAGADLTRIISLNKSARLLYEQLCAQDFAIGDVAKILVDTYGIDLNQAQKDAEAWVDALKKCMVIE